MGLDDLVWLLLESATIAGAAAGLLWALYAKCSVPVPPNRALVLYGRRASRPSGETGLYPSDITVRRPRIVVGGRAFVAPWDRGVDRLSLTPIAVGVTIRSMHALEGTRASGWEVRLQAQAKIPAEPGFLAVAAENLLGKTEEDVRALLGRTLEGAVPAVLARLKPEEGEPDWDRLAAEVQASVAPDLVALGLAIQTLAVTELHRIVPATPPAAVPATRPVPVTDANGAPAALGSMLRDLDSRLLRTERNLRIIGTELLRLSREATREPDGSREGSVFDLPLGSEAPVPALSAAAAPPLVHDSIGGDRSPRYRTSPIGGSAEERGRDPWPPVE